MYDGPVRGGNRGGQGDFRWEDVKNSKHRENYLGATVNAPVGRWQNNRDVHWYSRNVDSDTVEAERRKEEIRKLKEQEEEALTAVLGFAPSRRLTSAAGEGSGANSIRVDKPKVFDATEDRGAERRLRKEERSQRRAERRAKRAERDDRYRDRGKTSDGWDRDTHRRSKSEHHRDAERLRSLSESGRNVDGRRGPRSSDERRSTKRDRREDRDLSPGRSRAHGGLRRYRERSIESGGR